MLLNNDDGIKGIAGQAASGVLPNKGAPKGQAANSCHVVVASTRQDGWRPAW